MMRQASTKTVTACPSRGRNGFVRNSLQMQSKDFEQVVKTNFNLINLIFIALRVHDASESAL